MTLLGSTGCRCSSIDSRKCIVAFLLFILSVTTQTIARTQQQADASNGGKLLTATQVVERLVEMNLRRAQSLHSYHGTRTYHVEYRGLLGTKSADMAVDVRYLAPGTKDFTICLLLARH